MEKIGQLEKKLPLSRVVLFGSFANGNYTVSSDVDLLVVYKGKAKHEAFSIVKKTMDDS
jgi:predicted nucleotidyltransferase